MSDPSTGGKAACFEAQEFHEGSSQKRMSTSDRLYLYNRPLPLLLILSRHRVVVGCEESRKGVTDRDIRGKGSFSSMYF